MSEKVVVKAEKREKSGKGFARRLRMEGKIPVTVYGGGSEALSVSADLKEMLIILSERYLIQNADLIFTAINHYVLRLNIKLFFRLNKLPVKFIKQHSL